MLEQMVDMRNSAFCHKGLKADMTNRDHLFAEYFDRCLGVALDRFIERTLMCFFAHGKTGDSSGVR